MKLLNVFFSNIRYVLLYSILVLLLATFSLRTMEPQEIKQTTQSAIEQLPDEINQKIILYLTSANNLQEATKNIKHLFRTNKFFARFANDEPTNKLIIQEFSKHFANGELLEAATLNTHGAAAYIASTIENDEDANKIGKKLRNAVKNNKINMVNFIIKVHRHTKFRFIDKQNRNGKTALLKAALWDNENVVLQLLEAGADVNKQDKSGHTTLMHAVCFKQHEMIQQLLRAGADVNIKNISGNTVLFYAEDSTKPDKEIINLLKQAGAKE